MLCENLNFLIKNRIGFIISYFEVNNTYDKLPVRIKYPYAYYLHTCALMYKNMLIATN